MMKILTILVLISSNIKDIINIPHIQDNILFIIILFCSFIIYNINNNKIIMQKKFIKISKLYVLILLLITISFIFNFFSYESFNLKYFLRELKYLIIPFVFILILQNKKIFLNYSKLFKLVIYISSIINISQYFLYNFFPDLHNIFFFKPSRGIRYWGGFIGPNTYSIHLSFIIVFNLIFYLKKRSKINIILFLLLLLPFYNTYSRSGLFVLTFGLILTFYFSDLKSKLKQILIFLIILIMVLNIVGINNYYYDRLLRTINKIGVNNENEYQPTKARIKVLKTSLLMFKDNFLLGVGLGQHPIRFNKYETSKDKNSTVSHNEYLKFASELGIFGLIIIVVFIFKIIQFSYLNYKKKNNAINTSLLIFSLMFAASEMFYNYLFLPRISTLIWTYILGILWQKQD